ncbi:hypothetical protein MPLB_1460035 [Mesorhizobium sp. ORS 3324]|nr:hypothetical protein MPLB_1460035 [Mesorhizobium sp. ORS 3324]
MRDFNLAVGELLGPHLQSEHSPDKKGAQFPGALFRWYSSNLRVRDEIANVRRSPLPCG